MTEETNAATHLWWNGYSHAPGRTADEAKRWLMQECGEPAENCEGDGWDQIPDDVYMREEDGSISIPSETAAEMAQAMIEGHPLRSVA